MIGSTAPGSERSASAVGASQTRSPHPGYALVLAGHPVLNQKTKPVGDRIGQPCWEQIADGMLTTMRRFGGVGLAAPQVSMLCRMCVTEQSSRGRQLPEVLIDPVLLDTEGLIESTEGCLSIPGHAIAVDRARMVVVEYTTLDGAREQITARDFQAAVLQHELDHLDGVMIDQRALEHRARLKAGAAA